MPVPGIQLPAAFATEHRFNDPRQIAAALQDDLSPGLSRARVPTQTPAASLQSPATDTTANISRPVTDSFSASAFQQAIAARSQSFDLQIQTQDGDTVTISLSSSTASSRSSIVELDNNSVAVATRGVSTSESNVFYSIEGQLDEDELEAIDELVGDVTKLADKFFDGNVQNAFNRALRLDFDAEEISGFALSLQQTQLTQVSSAYEAVANLANDSAPQSAQQNPLQGLADFVDGLANVLQNESLESPADQVKGLFEQLTAALDGDSDPLLQALEQLVDELDERDDDDDREADDD